MKIVTETAMTLIYPFRSPDAEVSKYDCRIVLYPDSTVKIVWDHAPLMELQDARTLAQALLHAAEMAERGQK